MLVVRVGSLCVASKEEALSALLKYVVRKPEPAPLPCALANLTLREQPEAVNEHAGKGLTPTPTADL